MIEVATLEDAPRLAEMGELLHDTSSYAAIPYNRAKVEDMMRSLIGGAGAVFVIRKEGRIVGGLAGAVAPHWFSDELLGYEYSFFIEPDSRHGITAVKLVTAFTTWCKLRGAKQIRMGITTGINEQGTAGLYRMIGFKDAGSLFKLDV